MATTERRPSGSASHSSSNGIGLDAEDDLALRENDIQTTVPAQVFRLRYISTACLVINTTIGTGIFNTPSIIMRGIQSPGIILLLWAVGGAYAVAASYLYLVLGLSTPRLPVNNEEIGVPRSGGELNYFRYIFDRGRRSKFLATCIFGMSFIIFGNMAGNSLAFAQFAYLAAGTPISNGGVRGIAVLAATATCTIHSVSRRGGIWLSNLLAFIKIGILLLIIVVGFCAYRGVFGPEEVNNLTSVEAFGEASNVPFGYANGFLEILFSYAGWNQVNMVLSEVRHPRKVFKYALPLSTLLVAVLYMFVNVVYMLVVPVEVQLQENTAVAFFERTLARASGNSEVAQRTLNAFMAISSFGNIIVVTFCAARVKQELAKEGIIPWARFFGSGYDLSWRRLIKLLRGQDAPHSTRQETPVGALVMHWSFTVVLILATWTLDPTDAYALLIGVYSYLLEALFPTVIALGVLFLHAYPPERWAAKIRPFNPVVTATAAAFVAVVGLFPVVMSWVPPPGAWHSVIGWYGVVTTSWASIGFGVLYWALFRGVLPRIGQRQGKKLSVERDPHFSCEDGYPVLDHEVVRIHWLHKSRSANLFGSDEEGGIVVKQS